VGALLIRNFYHRAVKILRAERRGNVADFQARAPEDLGVQKQILSVPHSGRSKND
jgi:hypothetical protein